MPVFPVRPEKVSALYERMARLGIREADIEETFVRASGPGGQRLNKVAVCVRLEHRPSGLSVKFGRSRFQGLNRYHARLVLVKKIEARLEDRQAAEEQAREKLRRQKSRRSRRARQRMLADKRKQSEKKERRRPVSPSSPEN